MNSRSRFNSIAFQEFELTKELLNEVLERAKEIEDRKKRKQPPARNGPRTTTPRDIGPPPDDYRHLPIVPNVQEILSEERTYLRENIVNGAYKDPEHYLDVSFDRTEYFLPNSIYSLQGTFSSST